MTIKIDIKKIIIGAIILMSLLSFKSSLYSIFLICFSGIFSFYMLVQSKKNGIGKFAIFIYTLFILWGIISLKWAKSPSTSLLQLYNMISTIVANITIIIYFITTKESFEDSMKWLTPIFLIYIAQSIFTGHFNSTGRFSATGAVNQFGLTTSYIYFFSLYTIKYKEKNKLLLFLLLIISIVLSLYSGSRKSLINLVLFTCFALFFKKFDKNIFKNIGKILVILLVAISSIFIVLKNNTVYNLIGYRIESLISYYKGDETSDLSALRRKYMKEDAIEIFKKNPIKGIGINNFKYVARYGTYAHSNYYEILACLGLIGLVLYYLPPIIALYFAFKSWKNNVEDSIIPFAFLIAFIITEFSNISYIYRILHVFIGLIIGITFGYQRDKYKEKVVNLKNENNNSHSI